MIFFHIIFLQTFVEQAAWGLSKVHQNRIEFDAKVDGTTVRTNRIEFDAKVDGTTVRTSKVVELLYDVIQPSQTDSKSVDTEFHQHSFFFCTTPKH